MVGQLNKKLNTKYHILVANNADLKLPIQFKRGDKSGSDNQNRFFRSDF